MANTYIQHIYIYCIYSGRPPRCGLLLGAYSSLSVCLRVCVVFEVCAEHAPTRETARKDIKTATHTHRHIAKRHSEGGKRRTAYSASQHSFSFPIYIHCLSLSLSIRFDSMRSPPRLDMRNPWRRNGEKTNPNLLQVENGGKHTTKDGDWEWSSTYSI